MAKEVIAPKTKECEHSLVHNEKENFVFCSKCGKRWVETAGYTQTETYTKPYWTFSC